ncbi:glycosyltransferase family 2 protein [Photobacterium leiognathi]|uniref:glycosyltransferase family 2 protein n=1 Tax=Photobacterium leiognathi TaxID=553611 RepID=UPI00298135E1|nr:glycosyltransferase [Photobacterium leiognathi]
MRKNILVSVICLTYNHYRYISQTLDSILAQDCDFELEIILHDDASIDGTVDVIKSYKEKYSCIKTIFRENNMFQKGYDFWNDIINCCSGDYLAFCEGDDYWVDTLKLKKQIDFLEKNPDYVIHVFDSYIEENGSIIKNIGKLEYLNIKKGTYDKEDLKNEFVLMPLTSCVRNSKDLYHPRYFSKSINGDNKLQLLLSEKGNAFVDDSEKVAVYRIISSGIWSSKDKTYRMYEMAHTQLVTAQYFYNKDPIESKIKLSKLVVMLLSNIGIIFFIKYSLVFLFNRMKSIFSKLSDYF